MAGNQNMSWQKISRFILCLLLLSVAACGGGGEPDDNPDGKTSRMTPADTDDRRPLEGSVLIDDDVDGALQESDEYELKIDGDHAPVIENGTLILTISYSGGCASHDFTLVTNGNFMESDPVQLVVALTHNANDDTCQAYSTERYSFDLEPIRTRYQEAYGTGEGSITLHLRYLPHPRHSGKPRVPELLYTFDTDDRPEGSGKVFINPDADTAEALRTSDPYQLHIDGDNEPEPVIENDTLTLTISYSGGCASHYFTLVTNGSFMESDPVQLVFALTHDDNGDTCEAYPTEPYSFDLEPIKTRYQEDYGTDEGSITLRLWHLGHPSGSVDAGFLDILYTFGS